MPRLLSHLASIAFILLVAATAAPAQTIVNLTSLDAFTRVLEFMKLHLESN